jgi:preprotein translocase subunit SecG
LDGKPLGKPRSVVILAVIFLMFSVILNMLSKELSLFEENIGNDK